ncbi:hypothetical protein E1B28_008028 [Marasmius oreades]|uniref:Uncharacterized protein n=1 Tax=Marasmius oreades TaxID=181124 RepID=A0A9P7UUD9_9AGAR|nr:uncharacterized protein E1B28_008028 [Marasmius oreades]KAG7094428.1 hypothetical protein E1B28_008028 [Marasmius oreades]
MMLLTIQIFRALSEKEKIIEGKEKTLVMYRTSYNEIRFQQQVVQQQLNVINACTQYFAGRIDQKDRFIRTLQSDRSFAASKALKGQQGNLGHALLPILEMVDWIGWDISAFAAKLLGPNIDIPHKSTEPDASAFTNIDVPETLQRVYHSTIDFRTFLLNIQGASFFITGDIGDTDSTVPFLNGMFKGEIPTLQSV